MRATLDFTIDELIRSATAERLGIDNLPPPEEMANLRHLAVKILQPLRDAWQRPIIVTSGYRSPALNKALVEQGTASTFMEKRRTYSQLPAVRKTTENCSPSHPPLCMTEPSKSAS